MQKTPRAAGVVLLALGCVTTASTAPGDSGTVRERSYEKWQVDAALVLERKGDPQSLAAAALLLQTAARADSNTALHALDLANQAADQSPDDHAIGWIRLRICELTPGCDVPGAATTVRWLDAENAAAWLPTLGNALKDHDDREIDRTLAGMATGKRFNLYWNPAIVLVWDAMTASSARIPSGFGGSAYSRWMQALSLGAASLIPPIRTVIESCKEAGTAAPRHESCSKVANLMQKADTINAQMIGFSLARHLYALDPKEVRVAAEHRRSLEWRTGQAAEFDTAFLPWSKSRLATHHIDLMRKFAREEDSVAMILREHHLSQDPPSIGTSMR